MPPKLNPIRKKGISNGAKEWILGTIAEAAFFGLLYYIQCLLKVEGNLWISSAILWALANIAIVFCPEVRKCYK